MSGLDTGDVGAITPSPPFSRRTAMLMWAHILSLAALILMFRYLPLQDYPEWVYHGMVLEQIVLGDGVHGTYELNPYVPPNAASTLLIGALVTIVPPELAGKLFLLMMVVLFYRGAVHFMRLTVSGHDSILAWGAFLFAFNNAFWHGNLSYYFGLGFALYGAHLLVRRGWADSAIKISLLVTGAYLSHFFSWFFILFIGLVAALLGRNTRRLRILAVATLPSALLFIHYVLTGPSGEDLPGSSAPLGELLICKLQLFAGAIHPFQRFKGVAEPVLLISILDYVVVAAMGMLVVAAAWRLLRVRRLEFNSLLAIPLPLLILTLPLFSNGIVYPGQRLVPFLMINVLAYNLATYDRLARRLMAPLVFVGIATFAYALYFTGCFDAMVRRRQGPVDESYHALSRQGGTDGFLRLEYYDALSSSTPMPIFSTGLIRTVK